MFDFKKEKGEIMKKINFLFVLGLIFMTTMFLASCESKQIISGEAFNVPEVLEVEEFDPEMNNIREAVDACNIILVIKYNDATSEEIALKFDMLEEPFKYQLNSEGRHYIDYAYQGHKVSFDVLVKLIAPTYTVRFYDNANNMISEQFVVEGKSAIEPTEAERTVEGYNFIEWDKSFNKVTSDLDVYGIYEKKAYIVRFYDYNNELISEQTIMHGEAAVEPTEAERAVEGVNFVEWDKSFENVTSDLDVHGLYEAKTYTVRFYGLNSKLISEQTVKHGESAIAPTEEELKEEGYMFDCWNMSFENITSDLDVYAVYTKLYVVKFYNCKNELISQQYVASGAAAVEPSEEEKYVPGYIFLKWVQNFSEITADTDVYGLYVNDTVTDTDGDGIIDYIEIELLELDYTKVDTDDDGITDDKEDYDNDGLSNLNEIKSFLKPNDPDTDDDGLIDGDEVDIYWTLPADPDTDGDGAKDGWEINNGFDPLEYNNSFEVNVAVSMPGGTNIDVEIPNLPGEYVDTTIIEESTDESIQNTHGSIGEVIQYNVSAEANITLTSEKLIQADDPVLMYFNTEKNEIETIEVSVSGSKATASITQYGNYVLVDRKVFEEKGQWRDVYQSGTYSSVEVSIVIDDSGSLGGDYGYNSSTGYFTGGTDPKHLRLAAARDFISNANSSVKIGIIKFDRDASVVKPLTTCNDAGRADLLSCLQIRNGIFDSKGQTYMYTGIQQAISQLSSSSSDALKVVVVFTDGNAHDTSYHSSTINSAKNNDIKIYTVGLGLSSSYFTSYLKPLATQTGGKFYDTNSANELVNIFKEIKEKIDMEADTDQDGLPDFFESGVDANGKPTLPTINGMDFTGLDKTNPDTDGDGYKDGVELEIYKYYSDSKPNQVMVWGIVNSDPTDASSIPQSE